jgi:hypothetical protein
VASVKHKIPKVAKTDAELYGTRYAKFIQTLWQAIKNPATCSLEDTCYLSLLAGTLDGIVKAQYDKLTTEVLDRKPTLSAIPAVVRLMAAIPSMYQYSYHNSPIIAEWLFRCRALVEPHGHRPPQLLPSVSISKRFPELAAFPQLFACLLQYETHPGMIAALLPILKSSKFTITVDSKKITCTVHAVYEQLELVVKQLCPALSAVELNDKCLRILYVIEHTPIDGPFVIRSLLSSLGQNIDLVHLASIINFSVIQFIDEVLLCAESALPKCDYPGYSYTNIPKWDSV